MQWPIDFASARLILPLTLTLLALAMAAGILVRRERRRRAGLLATVLEAVRHAAAACPDPLELQRSGDRLSNRTPAGRVDIPHRRLLAAAERGHPPAAVAGAALLLLQAPLRPLAGPLGLKVHGPRIRLCLLPAAIDPLLPAEPRWVRRPIDGLPLVATYRVDGRADACLTEDHLLEQAVDSRDIHGIALAVLRQELDGDLLVRRLGDGLETEVITSDGDTATAAVLVLPDFLPAGLALEAVLRRPDRLELRALAPPSAPPLGGPGPALRLRIDRQGWTIL